MSDNVYKDYPWGLLCRPRHSAVRAHQWYPGKWIECSWTSGACYHDLPINQRNGTCWFYQPDSPRADAEMKVYPEAGDWIVINGNGLPKLLTPKEFAEQYEIVQE
jgi:hypothetical protein